jgi:TRAP-type C4-dicarboxylate transport system substrate-binding protein
VLISLKYYKKLPNDHAKILSTTFPKAMADLTAALRAQNDEALQLIQKSGLTLIPMPAGADLQEFYAIHRRVAKRLTGVLYSEDVLQKVYQILNKKR